MFGEHRVATGLLGCVQVRGMGAEHQFQRLGQVLQQVEPVRDLHGPGRAMARTLGKGTRPVARDHGDAGVPAQPRSQRVRLAAREQRHRAVPFEVHQHGAVGVALAQSPIVDAKHGRGHDRRHGRLPYRAQQRVAACRKPELAAEARAG